MQAYIHTYNFIMQNWLKKSFAGSKPLYVWRLSVGLSGGSYNNDCLCKANKILSNRKGRTSYKQANQGPGRLYHIMYFFQRVFSRLYQVRLGSVSQCQKLSQAGQSLPQGLAVAQQVKTDVKNRRISSLCTVRTSSQRSCNKRVSCHCSGSRAFEPANQP